MAGKSAKQIDKTIQNNLDKLHKRGVLTVRPGFEIANHQLTGEIRHRGHSSHEAEEPAKS